MARSNDVQCRTIWRINTMTRTSRFGRASLYAAAAAGLLGFLAGGATWARPAAAQHAAARAAAAPAHVAAARAAAAPALDFSQTLPPGQPSAARARLGRAAANAAEESRLRAPRLKYQTVTAPNDFALANQIDLTYGKIENPPSGVPQMEGSATFGGNGIQDVFVGATSAYPFMLPITHWVSHMPGGVFWVDPKASTLPASTIAGLKRRMGHATIYVLGAAQQVPDALVSQLQPYGSVTRLTNDDAVAYNTPPAISAESTALAFAEMWDPMGMVGWNATGPGHGFTIVNVNDWQGAAGSAIPPPL